MELKESYRVFLRPDLVESTNLAEVLTTSQKVREVLNKETIKSSIAEVHKFGASSHVVQRSILEEMESLGFTSEKKGLFSEMKVSGIRPDYFKKIEGGGILFEVERGKTIANNMDLLDVWKTHICKEAKHLFLMVPLIRATERGASQKIFSTVENRIETFFLAGATPIDVNSVHLFGY